MRPTPSIKEDDIERFVRHPDAMEAELRDRVEAALAAQDNLYAIAAFLRRFYALFDALQAEAAEQEALNARVAAFANVLFPEEAFRRLVPIRQVSGRRPGVTVLAAVSDRPANRFETVCTLAAPDHSVLLRIVHDDKSGEHRLYVLSKESPDRAHALVTFPDLGLQFVTDERGRTVFEMPPAGEQYPWVDAQATFSIPVAVETLRPAALGTETHRALPSGHELHLSSVEGTLRVEVSYPEPGLVRLGHAVLATPEDDLLCALDEGTQAEWSLGPDVDTVILRLYQ